LVAFVSKIVAAGGAVSQWQSGGPGWAAMVRYNVDGSIDESFNGGPIIWASYGSLGYGLTAMALQNDGKVVVVGPAANKKITKDNNSYGIDVWNDDFGVSRLNPDGSFDSGFGYQGSWFIDFGAVVNGWGGYRDYPSAVAIQANGKIVIGGTSLLGRRFRDLLVVRAAHVLGRARRRFRRQSVPQRSDVLDRTRGRAGQAHRPLAGAERLHQGGRDVPVPRLRLGRGRRRSPVQRYTLRPRFLIPIAVSISFAFGDSGMPINIAESTPSKRCSPDKTLADEAAIV
jgi:uncharacterized delta-60 repeat protein